VALQRLPPQGVHGRALRRHAPLGADVYRRRDDVPASPVPLWSQVMADDITGREFVALTALRPDGKDAWGRTMWRCQCVCGEQTRVRKHDLIRGWTTSCGCRRSRMSRQMIVAFNKQRHAKKLLTIATLVALFSCHHRPPDTVLADELGHALVDACPADDDASDEAARDRCADRLTSLDVLRDSMVEPFIWGGQAGADSYSLDKGTSRFNPRVWRRMYLSTFMFGERFEVERIGTQTILHVPVWFRGAMPAGAYPYPFWHSAKKWDAYSYATTIHFVIEHGRVLGALRSTAQDTSRPVTAHTWDGRWRWDDGAQPHVSLYSYLFARGNPHVAELDTSYRDLEAGLRAHRCTTCHAPDNQGRSQQLELFVYPNQALAGRHDIVAQLLDDQMPPANDLGVPEGIADESDREHMLDLARSFERAGDRALAWEGECQ
jgi:hypothetical protein